MIKIIDNIETHQLKTNLAIDYFNEARYNGNEIIEELNQLLFYEVYQVFFNILKMWLCRGKL